MTESTNQTDMKMSNKTKTQDKNSKISEIDEHIRRNFDIKKRLGKGAYGIVWKAIDKKTQQTVAVKKIFDAFRNETDAQRTFREIMFLRAFRNHPNIVQLYSIHRATNHMDIYLSFEFMECDLHNVIKRGSILKDIHKRYVMYQLLNATNFIHSGNVIHRDMKPSNVLVDSKCRCKLADFGLARSLSPNHYTIDRCSSVGEPTEQCLTDYVATRWYRAPEILIANKTYTKGIDMWSLGCILGEMIRGKPLFPGSCTVNQVECIVSALPKPSESDLKSVGNGFGSVLLNQSAKLNGINNSNPNMDELLLESPIDAKHLIKSLLVLDPTKRLTAKQALYHKYVERFRNTIPELELTADIVPPFRDDIQLSVSEYRSKLYEIMSSTEKTPHLIKKSSSSSSPVKSDSSPTTSTSVQSTLKKLNGVHHLPNKLNSNNNTSKSMVAPIEKKTITKTLNDPFSSIKCHSDIKSNSQYTNTQQPKSVFTDLKTTSTNPSNFKSVNGSYTRITNKLNCCKSCSQDTDESTNTINRAKPKALSMPKLKNNCKYFDSFDHNYFDIDDELRYKGPEKKRSIISATFGRRASMDANGFLRKASFKRSLATNQFEMDNRRQSLDESTFKVKAPTNAKLITKLASTQETSNTNEPYRYGVSSNGRLTSSFADKCEANRAPSIENKKLMKQRSLTDDYYESNTRLKSLENKMQRHKIDVLKFINDQKETKNIFEQSQQAKKPIVNSVHSNDARSDKYFRSKLEQFVSTKNELRENSTKLNYSYPKLGIENVLQNNKSRSLKNETTTNGSNYAVISAADLYKLRSSS